MSKKEKKILRSFMMITQISITMLVPIFISGWLGTWLNRLFGTQIIFPFMLLLGIGAAFKNVYILTKSFYGLTPGSMLLSTGMSRNACSKLTKPSEPECPSLP